MTRRDVARRRRQLAALRAYIEVGSIKGVAHDLGVTERAARKLLTAYCAANGYASIVQAAYWLGRPSEQDRIGTSERDAALTSLR